MDITCIRFRAVDARRLFTCVASITHAPDIALLIAMIQSVFRSLVLSFKNTRMKPLLVKSLPPCVLIRQTQTAAQLCFRIPFLLPTVRKKWKTVKSRGEKKLAHFTWCSVQTTTIKRKKEERRRRKKCGKTNKLRVLLGKHFQNTAMDALHAQLLASLRCPHIHSPHALNCRPTARIVSPNNRLKWNAVTDRPTNRPKGENIFHRQNKAKLKSKNCKAVIKTFGGELKTHVNCISQTQWQQSYKSVSSPNLR